MRDSHVLPSLGSGPATVFEHVPYLVTRIVPTMYHIILLPEEIGAEDLVDVARRQADANRLPTCLVVDRDAALYIAPDHDEHRGAAPRGGIVLTGRLGPCRQFRDTPALAERRAALDRFIAAASARTGRMIFGDLTKGGQPATLEERALLAGAQPNGVPRGLVRCGRCGDWQGRCLDPSPRFAGQLMRVHCSCANDNRCAACGQLLHTRKLNANEYSEADGKIWHTPGFSALGHRCAGATAREDSPPARPGPTRRDDGA